MNIYGKKLDNIVEIFSRTQEMLPDYITAGTPQMVGTKLTFLHCTYSRYSRKYDRVLTHKVVRCVENTPSNMDNAHLTYEATNLYREIIREIGLGVERNEIIF